MKTTRRPAISFRFLLLVMPALAAGGCATLDRDECMVADWRLIGYQDGVAGKPAAAIGEYRKACAKHAVVPDLDAWRAGRTEGLQEYCKADNGYRLGWAGKGYPAVCPVALEPVFRAAYNEGREIYRARSAVNRTRTQIDRLNGTLDDIEHEKKDRLAALVSDGLDGTQRVMILVDIGEMEKEKDAIEHELDVLYVELEAQQARLDSLNRQVSR